jgi:dethiobiotin synthetase
MNAALPPIKGKIYFIAAVGTDIGKSFFIEKICRVLRKNNRAVVALKPVVSGFVDDDKNSDPAKILAALGLELSEKNLDAISPWRFTQPLSPHFAAKNSGKKIDFLVLKNFCLEKISAAKKNDQFLFIEGAGGVMTPINDDKTFLDLAAELQIPTLLLTANYLGAISHTLCAVEALKARKIPVEKILINEGAPLSDPALPPIEETLQNFSAIDTITFQRFFLD